MKIREIKNANEGNEVESLLYTKIQRHVFMMYPLANIEPRIATVYDERRPNRVKFYIFIVGEYINFVMLIPPELVRLMVDNEFYTPFNEASIGKFLDVFVKENEDRKKLVAEGIEIKTNVRKPVLEIHSHYKNNRLLNRFLGVLK